MLIVNTALYPLLPSNERRLNSTAYSCAKKTKTQGIFTCMRPLKALISRRLYKKCIHLIIQIAWLDTHIPKWRTYRFHVSINFRNNVQIAALGGPLWCRGLEVAVAISLVPINCDSTVSFSAELLVNVSPNLIRYAAKSLQNRGTQSSRIICRCWQKWPFCATRFNSVRVLLNPSESKYRRRDWRAELQHWPSEMNCYY